MVQVDDFARAMRVCPRCGHHSPILNGEALWPSLFVCVTCGHQVSESQGFPILAPDLNNSFVGYPTDLYELLFLAEAGHYWFEPRSKMIRYFLRKYFPVFGKFLEVGCGTGFVLNGLARDFPDRKFYGAEIYEKGLSFARQRIPASVELFQADARALPFVSTFDVIGAFDVLEHIEDDERVLESFQRALVPGGGLLLNVPQHPSMWSRKDVEAGHVRRYRRKELEKRLCKVGFELIDSTSYVFFLAPLMIISRFWQVSEENTPAVDENDRTRRYDLELKPSAALNGILHLFQDMEVGLMSLGLRYPGGGSRFVVARKGF